MLSSAVAVGAERARADGTSVLGLRAALRLLKDPEVGRGLGLVAEIARALGRRIDEAPA